MVAIVARVGLPVSASWPPHRSTRPRALRWPAEPDAAHATPKPKPKPNATVSGDLLRNTLKLTIAAFITASVAVWTVRVAYVWYPLLAVVVVVDDNDEQSLKAAAGRVLGTITGGLVTFMVHTLLAGWTGVLVSLLLMLPLLRLLGWQSSISTATLVSLMFLMIPSHAELNWPYVFNRGLDTAIGCLIAIGVSLLFWPRDGRQRLRQLEASLREPMRLQLAAYRHWLSGCGERPEALAPASLTASLSGLEGLLERELSGPHGQELRRRRWPQRVRLWAQVHHHWITWERLLAALPSEVLAFEAVPREALPAAGSLAGPAQGPAGTDQADQAGAAPLQPPGGVPSPSGSPLATAVHGLEALMAGRSVSGWSADPHPWVALARRQGWPPLMVLAIAEELRPLQASVESLRLAVPWR